MKRPLWKRLTYTVTLISTALFMAACSKNESDSKSRIRVALTDAPGDFKAVYIDVQEVNVNYSDSDDNSWQTLPGVKKGLYNLLTLVNDKDTLLADAEVVSGTIKEIRLVLGDNNWVVTNAGDSIKLQTSGGPSSGAELKINVSVSEGERYKLLLDFDVAKSIRRIGKTRRYIMKPVIRPIMAPQGGSIKGVVLPAVAPSAVLLLSGADTVASTYTSRSGAYMLKGIAAGRYSLYYISTDSTLPSLMKQRIVVQTGEITKVDTVTLDL